MTSPIIPPNSVQSIALLIQKEEQLNNARYSQFEKTKKARLFANQMKCTFFLIKYRNPNYSDVCILHRQSQSKCEDYIYSLFDLLLVILKVYPGTPPVNCLNIKNVTLSVPSKRNMIQVAMLKSAFVPCQFDGLFHIYAKKYFCIEIFKNSVLVRFVFISHFTQTCCHNS